MRKNLLQANMKIYNDTGETLAEYLGINKSTLSTKMNGHKDFTQGEIHKIKIRYNLTAEEVDSIFFADEVS